MKHFILWSRSRLLLPGPGAVADPSRSEPESAPGPWPSGASAALKVTDPQHGLGQQKHICVLFVI